MSMLSRILPVIDLQRGQVVHGIAGERDRYQPLVSQLVDSPHPGRVAKALCDAVAADQLYVADLDAIAGAEPDWNGYRLIGNQQLRIWVDAGCGTVARAERFAEAARDADVARVIVALESLETLRSFESIVCKLPLEKCVFSLDLREGKPVTNCGAARRLSADTIASYVVDVGVRSMIVLDVASVGMGRVSTVNVCRRIKARHADVELISGGGVCDLADIQRFVDAGCDKVLVASALHSRALG